MTWHLGRLGVLDTETTAPDPEDARTVTACIGAVGGGEPTQVVQRLINPGVEIPQGAIDVHGITNEHAITNGLDPAIVIDEVVNWLEDWWSAGLPVVAYNAAYDFTVIDREARRHLGRALDMRAALVIDPFVIDRRFDKYRKGKRILAVTCEHYRVALDGAHDATADAVAAARVAYRLAQKYERLAAMTLEELQPAQARWHAERQADFRAYRERIGEPLDDISEEWPMRAYQERAAA